LAIRGASFAPTRNETIVPQFAKIECHNCSSSWETNWWASVSQSFRLPDSERIVSRMWVPKF
jgi:hypothetical protein